MDILAIKIKIQLIDLYIKLTSKTMYYIKSRAQYVKNDPDYLNCMNKDCQESVLGKCVVATCSGSLTFHVINIRTNIEFVFFAGGFDTPCILTRSNPLDFTNPNMPLYGHLSSIDSTGKSVRSF